MGRYLPQRRAYMPQIGPLQKCRAREGGLIALKTYSILTLAYSLLVVHSIFRDDQHSHVYWEIEIT